MKILYLANIRIPSEKGETQQVMKMCEAFTKVNTHGLAPTKRGLTQTNETISVELVVPRRQNPDMKDIDPFEYFNLKRNFTITKLPTIDLMPWRFIFGKFAFRINYFVFSLLASWYALRKVKATFDPSLLRGGETIIYSREWRTLNKLKNKRKNLVFELHDFREQDVSGYKKIENSCRAIVVITEGLKKKLVDAGILEEKIIIAPDAVNINEFEIPESKEYVRKKLELPRDQKLVIYTGQLFEWKGVYTLADAFGILQDGGLDIRLVLVGGLKEHVEKMEEYLRKESIHSVIIVGHKPYTDMPFYLHAADALVLGDSQRFDISREYTSPLKLFQYMASQKPIVASATPALTEIVSNENAWLYEPDNPLKLAKAITDALTCEKESNDKAGNSWELIQEYTWEKRAERILKAVSY